MKIKFLLLCLGVLLVSSCWSAPVANPKADPFFNVAVGLPAITGNAIVDGLLVGVPLVAVKAAIIAAILAGQGGGEAESAPAQSYGPPVDSYGPPQAPPSETYGPPEDSYGAPQAPPIDSYGSPAAPPIDSYGSPAAPVVDSFGSPVVPVDVASVVPTDESLDVSSVADLRTDADERLVKLRA